MPGQPNKPPVSFLNSSSAGDGAAKGCTLKVIRASELMQRVYRKWGIKRGCLIQFVVIISFNLNRIS
jgi:hypothetical protein